MSLEKVKSKKHQELEKRSFESPDFPSSEHRGALIFEKNASLIGEDPVFGKMFESLVTGWNYIDKKQRKEVLDLIEELIEKLREYHDSYTNLKGIPGRRFYFDDINKLQRSAEAADQREKILHDSFIDDLNILSRKMKNMGLNNSWRRHDLIYGLTPETAREKPKLWMFKIFGEPLPKAVKR